MIMYSSNETLNLATRKGALNSYKGTKRSNVTTQINSRKEFPLPPPKDIYIGLPINEDRL